jgi:DNA-binding response OmpR family regulator
VFNPDLITLDVMMPGLTTREILEKLKERKLNPKIILLTVVRYSENEREQIKSMGNIVNYIIKPFDPNELIKQVNFYLS